MAVLTNNRRSGIQAVFRRDGDWSETAAADFAYPTTYGTLGEQIEDGEFIYQRVQLLAAASNVASGATLYWNAANGADFVVHDVDQTQGTAGEAADAITAGNYGWVKFTRAHADPA